MLNTPGPFGLSTRRKDRGGAVAPTGTRPLPPDQIGRSARVAAGRMIVPYSLRYGSVTAQGSKSTDGHAKPAPGRGRASRLRGGFEIPERDMGNGHSGQDIGQTRGSSWAWQSNRPLPPRFQEATGPAHHRQETPNADCAVQAHRLLHGWQAFAWPPSKIRAMARLVWAWQIAVSAIAVSLSRAIPLGSPCRR